MATIGMVAGIILIMVAGYIDDDVDFFGIFIGIVIFIVSMVAMG
jgi:hypothetical protein